MTAELGAAFVAALLLIAHITAQAAMTWITSGGIRWGLGTRDSELDRGAVAGRIDRALRNYLETLPLFLLALVLVRETGTSNALTATGAILYVAGRALYMPIYAAGVPVIRSVVWGVATLGPVLMLAGALSGTQGQETDMSEYDLIVIGAGPGGYVCAIRAAQLGMKVACVEGRGALGGTCLNVGCIPSKALLHASHFYHEAEGNFAKMGIVAEPKIDIGQMQTYRAQQVKELTGGVAFLFKKNKVDWIDGWGRISKPGEVSVALNSGETQVLKGKNIVIATGSEPASLPGVEVDEERVVTSTGGLTLNEVPKKLVVIGAGVIGLELGSVWRRLGAEVQVIEFLDTITPGMDGEVAKTFQKILTKQGLEFTLGAAVQGVSKHDDRLDITYKLRKDDSEHTVSADIVLLATGRRPYTSGLGLEEAGVTMNKRGMVETDGHWKTNVDGIYAIGDVIAGPMLAHKAEDEGVAVAEHIAGQHGHVNYGVIPGVIYTDPEVASVGQTEEQLKEAGRAYKVGKFPFMANGRAKAIFSTDGFVKVLADKHTDRILGVHVIGPAAGDMIHEYCVAMEFGAAAEDIARTCHAHPTFSEAMREAAMACGSGAIHV